MKSEIHIKNEQEECQIDIEGTIGVPEEWQFEKPDQRVATYEKFREKVQQITQIQAPKIIVNIRSTGGDVNDALLIHDALSSLNGHITTRCFGYTASAATIIAQAASEGGREISQNTLYLIHNSIASSEGNADELEAKVDLLRKTDLRLAQLYALRSGHDKAEFQTLMSENNGNGRWLSPEEVIEAGLADTIIDKKEGSPSEEEKQGQKEEEHNEKQKGKQGEEKEPIEKSAEENPASPKASLSQNIQRGWRRLMDVIFPSTDVSKASPEALPEDKNILHFDDERLHLERHSILAQQDKQRQFSATSISAKEDPSFGDSIRSNNERAYAEDVECFKN